MGEADLEGNVPVRAVLSPSGSFLATSFGSRTRNESTIALHEIETMTKTQSVVMPGFMAACVAVSPDSKQLAVYGGDNGRIRLLQTDGFSIQRNIDTTGEAKRVCSVAFDPTCQVLAIGYQGGRLELRSL
jgi:WD40 repeat protein